MCTAPIFAQVKFVVPDTLKFHQHKKELSLFINAVTTAGLDNIFTTGQPVTIFAPDNGAFEKLPAGLLDSLLKPANKIALVNLLNQHIIAGKLTISDVVRQMHLNNGQAVFTTLYGNKLIAKINANRNIVLVDEAGNETIVKQFNIQNGDAVIFIIGMVILAKK